MKEYTSRGAVKLIADGIIKQCAENFVNEFIAKNILTIKSESHKQRIIKKAMAEINNVMNNKIEVKK